MKRNDCIMCARLAAAAKVRVLQVAASWTGQDCCALVVQPQTERVRRSTVAIPNIAVIGTAAVDTCSEIS